MSTLRSDFELPLRARLLSDSLLFGPPGHKSDSRRPFADQFGIRGVAVLLTEYGPTINVLVDAPDRAGSNERVPGLENDAVKQALSILFQGDYELWADIYAIRIEPPELQVETGEAVKAAKDGTLGVPVKWSHQRRGMLISGHVAGAVGTRVSQPGFLGMGGTSFGTVVASLDPNVSQTGADVAVVELDVGIPITGPPFSGTGKFVDRGNISIVRQSGLTNAAVMGKAEWIHFPAVAGPHAGLYMTSQQVTQPGDSGTAVVDPSTNDVIGHVVGASTNFTSYIQDINYQFSAIRTLTGFSGLSL